MYCVCEEYYPIKSQIIKLCINYDINQFNLQLGSMPIN